MAANVQDQIDALVARSEVIEGRVPRGFGVTVEEARERLGRSVARRPETIARFRGMYGSFDGPEDLSERMRDYVYGEERVGQR